MTPGQHHSSAVTDFLLTTCRLSRSKGIYYNMFSSGGYLILREFLANSDWTCVYSETVVHSAVGSLNALVNEFIVQAIPISYSRTNKFPH